RRAREAPRPPRGLTPPRRLRQTVERPVLPFQIRHVGLDREIAPRHPLRELRRRELGAVTVDVLLEPVVKPSEGAPPDVVRYLAACLDGGREELRGEDVPQRVTLELTPDQPVIPVNVLEH